MVSILLFAQAQSLGVLKENQVGKPVQIVLWVQYALNVCVCLFLAQLIYFHIWLNRYSMTTFSYI